MARMTLNKELISESPRIVVFSVAGQVDHSNNRQVEDFFEDVMQAEQPKHVLLDLSDLLFGDSSFLSLLILWRERVRNGGGQLVLFGLRPEIHSLLRVVSFDRILDIRPDRQSAREAITG